LGPIRKDIRCIGWYSPQNSNNRNNGGFFIKDFSPTKVLLHF
jgi:hypothetical protein